MSAHKRKTASFIDLMKIIARITFDRCLCHDERRDLQDGAHRIRRNRQAKRRVIELEKTPIRCDGRFDMQRIACQPRTHKIFERSTAKHCAKRKMQLLAHRLEFSDAVKR